MPPSPHSKASPSKPPQYEAKGFHALCAIDAPERVPSYWHVQWYRLVGFLRSRQGIGVLIGLVLIGLSIPLLGLQYLLVQQGREGLASVSLYAPKPMQVLDSEATRLKIEQTKSSLPPVYKAKEPINSQMRDALQFRMNALQKLMDAQSTVPTTQLRSRYVNLMGDSALSMQVYDRLVHMRDKPAEVQQMSWETIRMGAQATLDRLMEDGLSTQAYLNNRKERIDEAMPSVLNSSPDEQAVVHLLVRSILRPNLVIDEEAQQLAKNRVEQDIKPVFRYLHKGEQIVERGETLSEFHRQAMRQLGIAVDHSNWLGLLGISVVTTLLIGILWLYLALYNQGKYFRPGYLAMMGCLTLVTLLAFKLQPLTLPQVSLLWMPFATYSLLIAILMHPRVAIFASTLLTFLLILTLRLEVEPLAVLLLGSLAGVFVFSQDLNFKDRKHLIGAVLAVCAANGLTILALFFSNIPLEDRWEWSLLAWSLLAGLASGLTSGILTVGLLPFVESVFRLVSPYTLLELANHDQPLLKRLQFEAPGTFHHSLMIANLSEAAAEAIGANALLTRVGCLYHDIGKMRRPLYFIENQAYFGSDNPHDRLPPRLSKRVITAHPRDSIEMARQHGLPEMLQAFMTEHHGTLMCGYFYYKAVQEEGEDNVSRDQFRYAGPKPRSKETAIVMLADAAESAVRALKNPSLSQIEELIDKLIKQRVDDGQFDDCPLTFHDLRIIRETFIRVLMGIQHNRINYQDKILREFGRKPGATYESKAGQLPTQANTEQPGTLPFPAPRVQP